MNKYDSSNVQPENTNFNSNSQKQNYKKQQYMHSNSQVLKSLEYTPMYVLKYI